MKLTTFGAARTVTGSMHLIEHNGHKLLLECGTYQGKREESYHVNLNFPFDPASIDAMILSHAHIDHSSIPQSGEARFSGSDLCDQRHHRSGDIVRVRISRKSIIYLTRSAGKKGKRAFRPIYTQKMIEGVRFPLTLVSAKDRSDPGRGRSHC